MNKELKHTKGPWSIVEHNWRDTSIVSHEKTVCMVSLNEYNDDDYECDENTIKEIENSANIKLMAAAPDLLEAIIEAEEALKWFMSNTSPDNKNDYQSYHDTGMNAIEQAKNAIQKAIS